PGRTARGLPAWRSTATGRGAGSSVSARGIRSTAPLSAPARRFGPQASGRAGPRSGELSDSRGTTFDPSGRRTHEGVDFPPGSARTATGNDRRKTRRRLAHRAAGGLDRGREPAARGVAVRRSGAGRRPRRRRQALSGYGTTASTPAHRGGGSIGAAWGKGGSRYPGRTGGRAGRATARAGLCRGAWLPRPDRREI